MTQKHGEIELDDDFGRLDLDQIHAWLTVSYWSPGVTREGVGKQFENSPLTIGAYRDGRQVGVLRVISDRTTFAWVCDVWVDESARRLGLAKAMVRFALAHPDFQGLRQWALGTRDAHDVYRECGFDALEFPERWMVFRPQPLPA